MNSQQDLENLEEEHKFEKLTQAQYEHVLIRMKKDLIATQLRAQDMRESTKSKEDIVGQEKERLRKVK